MRAESAARVRDAPALTGKAPCVALPCVLHCCVCRRHTSACFRTIRAISSFSCLSLFLRPDEITEALLNGLRAPAMQPELLPVQGLSFCFNRRAGHVSMVHCAGLLLNVLLFSILLNLNKKKKIKEKALYGCL